MTYRSFRWSCPYQRSIDATRFGDTTPGSFERQGQRSHTEDGDRSPAKRDHKDGNGKPAWEPAGFATLERVLATS
ncbi:hypothetical protein OPAG_04066 [Rhodococcus opacus PD630]|nr:hypothetical protein Pd630_LPD03763 [Rhodococcus opacus PD630]EHI47260.1 hypothetical protein OPAG_04066 [Rhodococcus opacus PD630]